MSLDIKWGPSGEVVYNRTYSRVKPDGERETWPETVERVVDGNLALGDPRFELPNEREELIRLMTEFKVIPAGRHLWASGVKGRQYLFNCHVSGWGEKPSDHFEFTFMRLMEGGGVGANYSNKYLAEYPEIHGTHRVHIVCDPEHADYQKMLDAGLISTEYDHEWPGAFEVEDSREGWAEALVDLIDTYYRQAGHEARVFDVSRVRPEGARLKTFGGRASGPKPLAVMLSEVSDVLNIAYDNAYLSGMDAMSIDHAIAKCVVSGGNRRSARMAIMHWADPEILDFIDAKQGGTDHWTTNISVEVDDEFFSDLDWDQTKAGQAQRVLNAIAEGMIRNGEPGFWNSSLSNKGEPNPVIATNPCGEIPLEAWENCNLGHVNLGAFVNESGNVNAEELFYAHDLMTRFLIRATYGDVNDPKQADVLARNRRIGVGHLGVATFLAKRGIKYSEAPESDLPALLSDLSFEVEEAARKYSHDLRIPVPVKTRTVAPTGTIAKLPGVSEGIHPIFAKYFVRRIRFSTIDEDQMRLVKDYEAQGYLVEDDQYAEMTKVVAIPTKDTLMAEVEAIWGLERAEELVESAADLSLDEMLEFQAMYQEFWADNAVSYTVNVDPKTYTVDDMAKAIRNYGYRLKGGTVFPEQSFPQAPYERITKEEFEMAEIVQIADGIDEECRTGSCPVR